MTTPKTFPWRLARRSIKMSPSAIREILKITERPGIISFAGGLPSPKTFPVIEFEAACAKLFHNDGMRPCNMPPVKALVRCVTWWQRGYPGRLIQPRF